MCPDIAHTSLLLLLCRARVSSGAPTSCASRRRRQGQGRGLLRRPAQDSSGQGSGLSPASQAATVAADLVPYMHEALTAGGPHRRLKRLGSGGVIEERGGGFPVTLPGPDGLLARHRSAPGTTAGAGQFAL